MKPRTAADLRAIPAISRLTIETDNANIALSVVIGDFDQFDIALEQVVDELPRLTPCALARAAQQPAAIKLKRAADGVSGYACINGEGNLES